VRSCPPPAPLRGTLARLEAAGLVAALGGSGLLAALGLAEHVRDWDLTTDEPWERVVEALAGEPLVAHGPDHLHADRKLALADGAVEVIVGFAFHTPGGLVRVPTVVAERRGGIPLGSPEGWAVAYHLLGRPEKRDALLGHLALHGADAGVLVRLLDQPLPSGLAARLAALPTSRDT
jgi:hypothetical protein